MPRHVHRCDYCPEMLAGEFDTHADCAEHELGCEFNPGNRTCATCANLHVDERCATRRVRPKCTVFNDRKYRSECSGYTPSEWARKLMQKEN